MGDTAKQEWAEKMADAVANGIDTLARAHAMNNDGAAQDAKRRLWLELRALIFGLDVRTHVKPD